VKESTIEAYLVKRVKELGGECRKVTWQGRKGAPDRLVMLPSSVFINGQGMTSTTWVELKAEGLGPLFPHTPHERQQHREHERMRGMGQRVVVVDSYAGVEELLRGSVE
jgi:hypothetical protein